MVTTPQTLFLEWTKDQVDYGFFDFPDFFAVSDCNLQHYKLLPFSFITNMACVWSKGLLDGHDFAVIAATTSLRDNLINPPDGLASMYFDYLGGSFVATVITHLTPASQEFLSVFGEVPSSQLIRVLPANMLVSGFGIMVSINKLGYSSLTFCQV